MSGQPVRYDTLVVRGSTSKEVPRKAAGGEVVAWSAGHTVAEHGPLEEFVKDLVDGVYDFDQIETIRDKASQALQLSLRQRDEGWVEDEEQSR